MVIDTLKVMSKEQLLAEILRLPAEERRMLLDEARESLPEGNVRDSDMTPELKAELDRRYDRYLKNPASATPWRKAMARIKSRKGAKA